MEGLDINSDLTTVSGNYLFVIAILRVNERFRPPFSSAKILTLFTDFKRGLRLGREKVLAGGVDFCFMSERIQKLAFLFVTRLRYHLTGIIDTFFAPQ
jgi:hypothetical protein